MKHNATVETQTEGGKKMTIISFAVPGQLKVKAFVNERNLVEKVESWNTNPVLGDVLTETTYSDYKDFGGVQFPTNITQKQAGVPTLGASGRSPTNKLSIVKQRVRVHGRRL